MHFTISCFSSGWHFR